MAVGAQAYEAMDLTDARDYAIFEQGREQGYEEGLADRPSVWGLLLLVAASVIAGGAIVEVLQVVR